MKLLITASLLMLSLCAVRAQNAAVDTASGAMPMGGYFVIHPQPPIITIRFDGNSEDIAKVVSAGPHADTRINHDGKAFNTFVRSTPSESYQDNLVDYAQREKNVSEYKKNIKSGKWIPFRNGE